ncbi:MAG: hypothetical protein HY674_22250 [Chloroflexi bacterium]|nr:hypothetical protein [Chloroflexota bacterium]
MRNSLGRFAATLLCLLGALAPWTAGGAPATLLFEDDFNRALPGWTAVQPPVSLGAYAAGPMRWQYDIVSEAFVENSNIYTTPAGGSDSGTAVMLINEAMTGDEFTFKARLIAGDNDGFGLIFGFKDQVNFYRVTFTREVRASSKFPGNGWRVDQRVNDVSTILFGHGTPDFVDSFVNRKGVPFDVTIQVAAGPRLSLTVAEDPDGAPTEFKLVENQALPSAAAGQVGLMVWGQQGDAPPNGFQIKNLSLEPVPLVGYPVPNPLPDWTPVVPPRATGDATLSGHGAGLWGLALGLNGPHGTLMETSDALGGNDAAGNVDFAAPSIVAGDTNWTDYVMTARIIPHDDDGHGVLVRYLDEFNYYRIALRRQSSANGVVTGLSIQKAVNGEISEVARDARFIPPDNVPYDITVAVFGNRLQVIVVGNPTGNAQSYVYGPFEITGGTVDHGKVGFFSWAMSWTEFDFIRVQGVSGAPLQVISNFGSPDPAPGLHGFPVGSSVTASVASPVEDAPGVRRVLTGWTGTGSVPATGAGNSVTFDLTGISVLTWNWRTEVRLAVSAAPGGQVTAPTGEWFPEGTNATVTAQPDAGFLFAGWSGDLASHEPALSLVLNRPLTLTANFVADTDNDGLPDPWEQTHLGGLAAAADGDPDHDGRTNLTEYRRGTDPNHAETLVAADGLASRWENVQRDPALPGQFWVRDFGQGFRGVWENSNDNRSATDATFIGATNIVDNASFEGPRLILRTNVWDPAWTNFTAQTIFSVADNDGNCVYFRYRDENNWYRVTILGEFNNDVPSRPVFGVSIQKRVNGQFAELARDASIATDPADTAFYKRVRITVTAQDSSFEVRIIGWDARTVPPDWAAASEVVLTFTDDQLPSGRFGIGDWGQNGGAATPENPVDAGVLIEDVVISVGGNEIFREDWELVPLSDQFPVGWTSPAVGAAGGTWRTSAHGTIMETSNFFTSSTGTTLQPKADGESTVLLAPAPGSANYFLEIGFHPFDDDGIGFVYDFQDTNNFSRVLFVSEPSGNGRVPQGLSVSRKSAGVWTDIIAGDNAFVFRNGSPFAVEFANNNGQYRLTTRLLDEPDTVRAWSWTGPAASVGNRFGLTAWGMSDAHFLYARAYSLPTRPAAGELRISQVTIAGGNLVLDIVNSSGAPFNVERSETLAPGSWTVAAAAQTGAQWTTPLSSAAQAVFYRLKQGQ